MKYFIFLILFIFLSNQLFSQDETNNNDKNTELSKEEYYEVVKNDGTKYFGVILSNDEREVLIRTDELGKLYIPKHEIKSITKIDKETYSLGSKYIGADAFASRHFLTANALPVDKGDAYILFRGFGPDFQMGITDNFGVGLMTTWIGNPLLGTLKYSNKLSDNVYYSIGSIIGGTTWSFDESSSLFIALPFTSLTFGNKMRNFSLTAGYGMIRQKIIRFDYYDGQESTDVDTEGRFLMSVAGMTKFSKKVSFIFDSFISPNIDGDLGTFMLIMPGIRWHLTSSSSFQLGFAGMYLDKEFLPFPLPLINYMYRF